MATIEDAGAARPTQIRVRIVEGRPFVSDFPYRLKSGQAWPTAPVLHFNGPSGVITWTSTLSDGGKLATVTATKAEVDTLLNHSSRGIAQLDDPSTGRLWAAGDYFEVGTAWAGGTNPTALADGAVVVDDRLVIMGGEGGTGGPVSWTEVTGKPSSYPPSPHRHDASEIDNLPSWAAAGATGLQARVAIGAQRERAVDSRDHASLAAAITAAAGAPVWVVGTHVTAGISLSGTTPTVLHFAPGAKLQQAAGSTTPLLSVTGAERLEITNGNLDGLPTSNANALTVQDVPAVDVTAAITNSGRNGAEIINSSGSAMISCREAKQSGVRLIDSSNFRLRVDIDGVDGSGVYVAGAVKHVEDIHVKGVVKNCARTIAAAIGVYFSSGDVWTVRHSSIEADVVNAGWIGIYPGGDHLRVLNSSVRGAGLVTAATGHGIRVHDSSDVVFTNCTVTGSRRSGFQVNKSHGVTFEGCSAIGNDQDGFSFTYDPGATGRYVGMATNTDVALSGCHANDNGQSAANTYAGYFVDGYRGVTWTGCHAHDYQAVRTQQRGIRAATNALTSGLSITSSDFRRNISGVGINVPAAYLAHAQFVDDEGVKAAFYGKAPVLRPTAAVTPEGIHAALVSLGLIA